MCVSDRDRYCIKDLVTEQSSFSNFDVLCFAICPSVLAGTLLNRSGESRHPRIAPDLNGKFSVFIE